MNSISKSYVTRALTPETWDDFAELVEANNGVWGGCWCIGFHPEGLPEGCTAERNRTLKQRHVLNATVHQESWVLRQGTRGTAGLENRLHLHR